MTTLGPDMITTADLQKRWRKASSKTIYRYARRYAEILQPVKMGRNWLFELENVRKFEKQMREIS